MEEGGGEAEEEKKRRSKKKREIPDDGKSPRSRKGRVIVQVEALESLSQFYINVNDIFNWRKYSGSLQTSVTHNTSYFG